VERRQARRRPIGLERVVEVTVLADMIKLVADHSPFRLYSVGDLAEVRNDLVRSGPEVAACEKCRFVHRHRLDHDHTGAAQRALSVIAKVAFTRQAMVSHVGGVRAEHDAVAQGGTADGQRGKQVGKRARHGSTSRQAGTGNLLQQLPVDCLAIGVVVIRLYDKVVRATDNETARNTCRASATRSGSPAR
jgi:hypothetical protein